MFNKACHPLGPCLYLKQAEGLLRDGRPIRPWKVSAVALQVLKHQPAASGEHFRVMQNVDDFGRVTVLFEDHTVAEVLGHELSISGIRNELSVIADVVASERNHASVHCFRHRTWRRPPGPGGCSPAAAPE